MGKGQPVIDQLFVGFASGKMFGEMRLNAFISGSIDVSEVV